VAWRRINESITVGSKHNVPNENSKNEASSMSRNNLKLGAAAWLETLIISRGVAATNYAVRHEYRRQYRALVKLAPASSSLTAMCACGAARGVML